MSFESRSKVGLPGTSSHLGENSSQPKSLHPTWGGSFIDPMDGILFAPDGNLDESTYDRFADILSEDALYVIGGFYGANSDGSVRTFPRGGSDITGAIVARAVKADIYENWTDVSGFLMADPPDR